LRVPVFRAPVFRALVFLVLVFRALVFRVLVFAPVRPLVEPAFRALVFVALVFLVRALAPGVRGVASPAVALVFRPVRRAARRPRFVPPLSCSVTVA
jgi:hypothetical protein